jgi:hypothetical protein
MASARQKAITRKRRRGIRPYCRKVALTPGPILKPAQWLGRNGSQLNPKILQGQPPQPKNPGRKRGAPPGNRNRLVHGRYTRAAFAFRTEVRAELRRCYTLVARAKALLRGNRAARGTGAFGRVAQAQHCAGQPVKALFSLL